MVLDTSVVVAYLLHEPQANAVPDLMRAGPVYAPDMLPLEAANALVNAARRGRIAQSQVPSLCALVRRMPIRYHPHQGLLERAVDISITWNRRPYVGVFVALAEMLDTALLTLDQKLIQGLQGTPLEPRVTLLAG